MRKLTVATLLAAALDLKESLTPGAARFENIDTACGLCKNLGLAIARVNGVSVWDAGAHSLSYDIYHVYEAAMPYWSKKLYTEDSYNLNGDSYLFYEPRLELLSLLIDYLEGRDGGEVLVDKDG